MKKENLLIGSIIAAILIIIILHERKKRKELELKNYLLEGSARKLSHEKQILQEDKLKILHEYLKISKEIPSEIVAQLEKLVSEYQITNEKVAKELIDILQLIENKMETKAIAALAKIIENLLKDEFSKEMLAGKYENEEEFKVKKKKIQFSNVIEYAKEKNFFTEHEYNLVQILKDFRNKESHELDVNLEKNWRTIAFLTGIEIVFKLASEKIE